MGSFERLDSHSEVALGLGSTCCLSVCAICLMVPFFDTAGLAWVRGWEGAHVPLSEFSERGSETYKTPDIAFTEIDKDSDGVLPEGELANGTALFVQPYDERETKSVFKQMDTDNDGSVSNEEWVAAVGANGTDDTKWAVPIAPESRKTTTVPAPTPPGATPAAGVVTTTTTTTLPWKACPLDLMAEYVGLIASIEGDTEVYLREPVGDRLTVDEFKEDFKPIFKTVMGNVLGYNISISEVSPDVEVNDLNGLNRSLIVAWEMDLDDGGSMQKRVAEQKTGEQLDLKLNHALQTANFAWMDGVTLTTYTHLEAKYYGPKASSIKIGCGDVILQQRFGSMGFDASGENYDESTAYIELDEVVTSRRV